MVAEDDPDIAEVVAFGARMTWPGCAVAVAASGEEALARFAAEPPDLVVIDAAMPPPDGSAEWGANPDYLKVFVRRPRQTLGDDAQRPRFIQTDWGAGYRFLAPR